MASKFVKSIVSIAHHRNGVFGAPFYAVIFFCDIDGPREELFATVFEEQGNCAVVNVGKLASGDIAFASNSFRGDNFEPELREAIAQWEAGRMDWASAVGTGK